MSEFRLFSERVSRRATTLDAAAASVRGWIMEGPGGPAEHRRRKPVALADVIGEANPGAGVSVWFGAVIRADDMPITIDAQSNVQEGTTSRSDRGAPLSI